MTNTFGFSKREQEVADLLLEGKSNKQIAVTLGISIGTIEFHLTNIYAKLGVDSRAGAIVLLNRLRKTPGHGAINETGEKARVTKGDFGESPVEKTRPSPHNGSERILQIREAADISAKTLSFFGKYKMLIAAIIAVLALATIITLYLYLSAPKPWNSYERECEYPDEFTVGHTIPRSNASKSNTHGQFGTTENDPWPAFPGYVIYKNINMPEVEQLYLKVRYSKNSPSSVPVLVYLDEEQNPRAAFYPEDQKDWNQFTWTDPIFLGTIGKGIHTVRFATDGQKYGVADLDKFVLSAGTP